jgi:hypothetical protein
MGRGWGEDGRGTDRKVVVMRRGWRMALQGIDTTAVGGIRERILSNRSLARSFDSFSVRMAPQSLDLAYLVSPAPKGCVRLGSCGQKQ